MTIEEIAAAAGAAASSRGARRLAETVVVSRGHTVRGRDRGTTMVSLVDSIAAADDLDAEIHVVEPDGSTWSVTLTSGHASREPRDR
ncbi:hypothetical protein [Actinokineospora diospyrosa]|uniref:Uncharacterized protein n=1 Tax=Actinokineospora diospyrosa TaxID=103728 RepID=A0ABT1IHB0_9PSEU|nr:hypothetical protein [Actinokineospora diospyrosa]MCP2272034.1 hypothetical protein [Actinokineospora diospyrosa]